LVGEIINQTVTAVKTPEILWCHQHWELTFRLT